MKNKNYVITIGREIGSGGHEIGLLLAQRLGIKFYDRELIDEASRESGVCCDMLERSDEKAPSLLDYALLGGWGNENVLSNGNFYVLQSKVIKRLAEAGPCVMVGRSADYLLRDYPRAIHLFIHAPKGLRAKRLCQRYAVCDEKALDLIDKMDAQRARYYNFYTDKVWGKSHSYDLSIDSSRLGIEATVDFLREYVLQVLAQ